MNNRQINLDNLITRIRERGNRLTPQRLGVLKTLIGNKEHLSAEEVYERVRVDFPMIGLATVYKTIAMLKEMGEITEININNDSARYDGRRDGTHPHFVCTKCNCMLDIDDIFNIEYPLFNDLTLDVAEKTGYKIKNYRLDFFGLCPNCQSG